MANKHLLQEMDNTPPQICFANFAGDFSPTAANDMRKGTDIQCELAMLNLNDGAAIQSAKVDLTEHFAERYSLEASPEMQVAAAEANGEVEFYWNPSRSVTPGTSNKGGASGVAGAYSGYSSDLGSSVRQLIPIGTLPMTDDGVDSVQAGYVGDLYPPHRYGSLIMKNECGQVICDTDDIEGHCVLNPYIPETQ